MVNPTIESEYIVTEKDVIFVAQDLVAEITRNPWERYNIMMELPPFFNTVELAEKVESVADEATKMLKDGGINKSVSYFEGKILNMSPYAILEYTVS